jgi:Glycogen recognition site of AMP-activated protein kinase
MRFVVAVLLVLAACRPPGYGRGDGDDVAVDANSNADAPPADGGTDAVAAMTCTKAFHLDGYSTATTVWLTGSFTQWAPNPPSAIAFVQGGGGGWDVTHEFPAGQHAYKFIVNGNNWILDPTNPTTMDDGMGNTNSAFTCVP